MQTYVTDLGDPGLRVILDEESLPDGATPYHEHTDLVILGVEEGVPAGFVNGATIEINGAPYVVMENMGIRPGFRGEGRSRTLFDAFAREVATRGHLRFITAVNLLAPMASHLQHLLASWGAQPYSEDENMQWWVKMLVPVNQG